MYRRGPTQGAGRPPQIAGKKLKQYAMMLYPEHWEWVIEQGDGNASLGIRTIIDRLMKKSAKRKG